jgi:hypothetical protein
VKIKSYVPMVIRYTRYVIESKSFIPAQNICISHLTYMYAQRGITHKVNGLVLGRVSFDTCS